METQLDLFNSGELSRNHGHNGQLLDKFRGAMAFSTIGDALGWPTEFGRYPSIVLRRFGKNYLSAFVEWEKVVGGRYWGYRERIKEGNYSDDTQLALSVARCINEYGDFQPDKFAYLELPLWLSYERGGGRSIKTAARSLAQTRRGWISNFYSQGGISYRSAGANGAAMRTLPIALVNVNNADRLYRDAFGNAIITHGHPRAILGSIIYASAVRFLLRESKISSGNLCEYLHDVIDQSSGSLEDSGFVYKWVKEWDRMPLNGLKFRDVFEKTKGEAIKYLEGIRKVIDLADREYYKFTGALDPRFRGSGISTVLVAVYLFSKYLDDPQKAMLTAVNMVGSDTDTIANFVGGLFGAYYGLSVVPHELLDRLQDREYILKTAGNLYGITIGEAMAKCAPITAFNRRDAFLWILAWEIGLHEMFWDALEEGEYIVHPALGRGLIERKERRPIQREGYEVKLIEVSFDCGQTCIFHHRVAKDGVLSESLSKAVSGILVSEKSFKELDSQIADIEGVYNFVNREDVMSFLKANRFLIKVLKEAYRNIESIFGASVHLYLELCADPEEDFEELLIVIKSHTVPKRLFTS
jgi:ADP-ribosylglycohydrolase